MLKLQQVEIDRLRSMSPADLDRHLFWITAIAMVLGFAVNGAAGVAIAMALLCLAGFIFQVVKKAGGTDSPANEIAGRSKISFQTFFLSVAGGSTLLLFFTNIYIAMNFMPMWALMFCLVSPFIKFSARQWRGVAIAGLIVSAGYIGKLAYDFVVQVHRLPQMQNVFTDIVPVLCATLALGVLFLLTCVLVVVGRLSRGFSSKAEKPAAGSYLWWQNITCYLRRATRQIVFEMPVYAFLCWYIGIVLFLTVPAGSVGDMCSKWLLSSVADANIVGDPEMMTDPVGDSFADRLIFPPSAERVRQKAFEAEVSGHEVPRIVEHRLPYDPFVDGLDGPPVVEEVIHDHVDDVSTTMKRISDANTGAASNFPFFMQTISDLIKAKDGNMTKAEWDALTVRDLRTSTWLIKGTLALGFLVFPFTIIMRLASFYATLSRRLMGSTGNLRLSESALAALRNTGDKLRLKYEGRFFAQAARTFWWLCFWYVVVFALVVFCPGNIIGVAIHNWMDASIADAGFTDARATVNGNIHMRIFIAALLAMYACGPLAVSGCAFLPHRSGRKVIVSEDGISLPDGPYWQMWLRTFRLYIDVKSVSLKGKLLPGVEHANDKRRVKLQFRTGGSFSFRIMDMPPEDLRLLLERIDEHAEDCNLSSEIVELRVKLSRESEAKSAHQSDTKKGKFKSSIFVPFVGGEKIEGHNLRIVKVLANKPLSAVYLVRVANGKLGVLKQLVMPKDDDVSREHLRIFQRECELMRELQHDGIARVIDTFNEGNNHFLLLEHFKGQDLKTVVDTFGARTVEEVADWTLNLCDVLEYLHAREIIHRDVTPENIVVGEHEGVRLIDFGAAHQFIEGITGTLIGKQSYVAPEQLRGKATRRSDIYSLGVTMSFLLTGKEPVALMQCELELGKSKSAQLMSKLIKAMTDFEEERRPESIQAVRQILLAVLDRKSQMTDIGSAKGETEKPDSNEAVPSGDSMPSAEASEGSEAASVKNSANDRQSDEAKLIVRTIQLMADAVPAETIKLKNSRKKKVKVRKLVNPEKQ